MSLLQGVGQYTKAIKTVEEDIQKVLKNVNELSGIKESDTGLAPPALWDLAADKQTLQSKKIYVQYTLTHALEWYQTVILVMSK